MLVGLSLSNCIKDIIEGRVISSDVDQIITGTRFVTEADWERNNDKYSELYWSHDPKFALELVRFFRASSKIDQPRIRGEQPPNISDGHWLKDGVPFRPVDPQARYRNWKDTGDRVKVINHQAFGEIGTVRSNNGWGRVEVDLDNGDSLTLMEGRDLVFEYEPLPDVPVTEDALV